VTTRPSKRFASSVFEIEFGAIQPSRAFFFLSASLPSPSASLSSSSRFANAIHFPSGDQTGGPLTPFTW
jgi:hypothetical protein